MFTGPASGNRWTRPVGNEIWQHRPCVAGNVGRTIWALAGCRCVATPDASRLQGVRAAGPCCRARQVVHITADYRSPGLQGFDVRLTCLLPSSIFRSS